MAVLTNLLVKIQGDNAQLKQSLDESSKKLDSFASGIGSKIKIGFAIAAAAAIAAGATFIHIFSDSAKQIDDLSKKARQLGVDFGALQSLQYAADLAGVSTETLNSSLEKMIKNISEASTGTGTAVKSLRDLGLNAATLRDLKPEQQFKLITDAMNGLATQGDKTAAAMNIFGRSGTDIVKLLGPSLKQAQDEFASFGTILTTQQGEAVEAFNDSITKIKALFASFIDQVVATTAPAFKLITDAIGEAVVQYGGLKALATDTAIVIVNGVIAAISAWNKFQEILQSVIVSINFIKAGFAQLKVPEIKLFGKTVLPGIGGGANGEGALKANDALDASIKKLNDIQQSSNSEIINNLQKMVSELQAQSAANAVTPSGLARGTGYIRDEATGQIFNPGGIASSVPSGISNGSGVGSGRQQIEVKITADKDGLLNALVNSSGAIDIFQGATATGTRDAARMVDE